MKKWKFYKIAIILYIVLIFLGAKLEAHAENKKIIAIVYDDSSSMIFDDTKSGTETGIEPEDYRTRWIEADYAVRAFVECKNPDDEVVIFPMNKIGWNEEEKEMIGIVVISNQDFEERQNSINTISSTFYNDTPYESIEDALSWLENNGEKSDEKWLIILTDGEFWESDYSDHRIEVKDLKGKIIESWKEYGSCCKILYFPLGNETGWDGEDTKDIKKITEGNGIQEKILAANNEIYKRNQLDWNGTEAQIDVPLSELIIIRQKEGGEYKYNRVEEDSESNAIQNNNEEEIKTIFLNQEDLEKTGENTYDSNSFRSYNAGMPSYEGNEVTEEEFKEGLLAKDIIGTIEWVQWESCNISGENVLSLSLGSQDTVYYQLNFDLEIEITQGGKRIEGAEVEEGEFEVNIYPVVSGEKEKRVDINANLLKDVEFYLNDKQYELGRPEKMEAVFGEEITLKAEAKGKAIEGSFTEEKKLETIEKIYPVSIKVTEMPDYFSYESLDKNRTEKMSRIKVRLAEDAESGGIPLRDNTKNNLAVEVKVTYKGLKEGEKAAIEVKTEYGESKNELYLYPYLVNENDFNEYEDVKCTVTVYRKDQEELSRQEKVIDIPLVALPVEIEALVPADTYSIRDMIQGKIKPEIKRNGEELLKEQWKNVRYIASEGDASKYIMDERRTLFRLLEIPYWFFYGEDEIFVCKEVKYMERGMEYIAIMEGTLSFQPVPVWIRGSLIGMMAVGILICLWIMGRVVSGSCFGWGFKAYLYIVDSKLKIFEREIIRPKRVLQQTLLPGKSIQLILSNNDDRKQEDFPDMRMRRDKKEKKFVIVNGEDFQKNNFWVNDMKIVDRTYIDPADCIKIIDANGIYYELYFKSKEEEEG